MADEPTPPELPGSAVPGSLTIADRVGARIVERAALSVRNVVESRAGVGSLRNGASARALTSGSLPRADVDMSSSAPRVSLKVALTWPSPITEVCRTLRETVIGDLDRLAGVRPAVVDVEVIRLIPKSQASGLGAGMVELPPAEPADSADEVSA